MNRDETDFKGLENPESPRAKVLIKKTKQASVCSTSVALSNNIKSNCDLLIE
jgi:hypothetical protein